MALTVPSAFAVVAVPTSSLGSMPACFNISVNSASFCRRSADSSLNLLSCCSRSAKISSNFSLISTSCSKESSRNAARRLRIFNRVFKKSFIFILMYHIFISDKLSLNPSISTTVFGTKMTQKIASFKNRELNCVWICLVTWLQSSMKLCSQKINLCSS
ncbi:hypothetical protein D3C86_1722370 [compost metagenome]